jgi:hypothetical protein
MNLVRERERESKEEIQREAGKRSNYHYDSLEGVQLYYQTWYHVVLSKAPFISRYFVSRGKNYSVVEKTYSASSV